MYIFYLALAFFCLANAQLMPSGDNCVLIEDVFILDSSGTRNFFFSWTVLNESDPLSDLFIELIVTNIGTPNWVGIGWCNEGPGASVVFHAECDFAVGIDGANPVGFTSASTVINTAPVSSMNVDNLISNRMAMQDGTAKIISFNYNVAGSQMTGGTGTGPVVAVDLNNTILFSLASAENNLFIQHNGANSGARIGIQIPGGFNSGINNCTDAMTNGTTVAPPTTTTSNSIKTNPLYEIISLSILSLFILFRFW